MKTVNQVPGDLLIFHQNVVKVNLQMEVTHKCINKIKSSSRHMLSLAQ